MELISPAVQQHVSNYQNKVNQNPVDSEIKTNSQTTSFGQKSNKAEANKNVDADKNSKKKKIIIGAAIGAAAIGICAVLLYKHKQAKVLKTMPEELKDVFENVKGKDGKEFIDSAYDGIKKYMGLDNFAPKEVTLTNNADGIFDTIKGGYSFYSNKIEYTKGFKDKLSKAKKFNMLSHELKHSRQYADILKTEGLGAEALAEALAEQSLNAPGLLGKSYIQIIKEGFPPEKAAKEIASTRASRIDEYLKKINEHYSDFIQNGKKYAANSPEGLHAKEYLKAIKQYEGLNILGMGGEKYRSNLIEVEAYSFGEKMEKLFNYKTPFFSKLKDFIRLARVN